MKIRLCSWTRAGALPADSRRRRKVPLRSLLRLASALPLQAASRRGRIPHALNRISIFPDYSAPAEISLNNSMYTEAVFLRAVLLYVCIF
jgi:hypothetical protein